MLVASEVLEEFLNKKWNAQPRFGLEGGETLIPGLLEIIDSAATNGAECIIIGNIYMPDNVHRAKQNLYFYQ